MKDRSITFLQGLVLIIMAGAVGGFLGFKFGKLEAIGCYSYKDLETAKTNSFRRGKEAAYGNAAKIIGENDLLNNTLPDDQLQYFSQNNSEFEFRKEVATEATKVATAFHDSSKVFRASL